MRRPLFTSGVPQIVPNTLAGLTILDLRSLNTELQGFTRFVTLYAAGQASQPQIEVDFQQGNSTPVRINYLAPAADITGGPVKVLDRFPLRGNARLFLLASNFPVVWGYFELDGSLNVDATTRPLQPGQLVSPFTYSPVQVLNGAPAATVHTLVEGYYDIIDLDVNNVPAEATYSILTVSDGVTTTPLRFEVGVESVRLFDGIPMMALSTNVPPVLSLDAHTAVATTAYGSFIRVS